MRDPRERYGSDRRRGGSGCALARVLQNPSGGGAGSGSENATFVVPADISTEARSLVQETAKTLYRALGCRGLARVDMFLKEDGTVVLNEVNTLARHDLIQPLSENDGRRGLPLAEVIDRIVSLALAGRSR